MVIAAVMIIVYQILLHFPRVQLAVMLGQGQYLVAGELDSSRLMSGDMPRSSGDHALIAAQQRGDHRGVGLGAAHQKVHVPLRATAGRQNFFLRAVAVSVMAVAGLLFQIGLHQPPKDGRMGSFAIIVFKIQHRFSLFPSNFP